MLKFRKSFTWAVLACTALCGGLTSCVFGEDDEDDEDLDDYVPEDLWQGELPDAMFENDAVYFDVMNREKYSSIELTSSGNYIIMPIADNYNYNSDTRAEKHTGLAGMFRSKKDTRYDYGANYENAIFGSFTKNDDGSYNLQGFGVLIILDDRTIELRLNDGSTLTLNVYPRYPVVDSNALNNRICRTWYVEEVYEEVYDSKGKRIINKQLSQDEIMDDYVEYVVMSKSGTFTQVDWDHTLDSYGHWWWDQEDLQIFGYQFVDEEDSYGSCGVKFNGDRAEFFETSYGRLGDLDEDEYDYDIHRGGYVTFQTRIVCRAH